MVILLEQIPTRVALQRWPTLRVRNGNVKVGNASGSVFNLVCYAENQPITVSGAATASFLYDGDGQRVRGTAGGVTTAYIGNCYE
ncbi:MAG: hypothetical protein ABI847_11820 [Anaerolineales bacterium]